MKQGNQFYLEIQIEDSDGANLDIKGVDKVQFVIKDLVKLYDGTNKEVSYDEDKKCFKIWLTEDETFDFDRNIKIDVRVLYKANVEGKRAIDGSIICNCYCHDSLKKIELDNNLPEPIVKVIVKNGTYSAVDDNVGYYDKVVVDVPEKKLGIKNIVQSGVKTVKYSANDDNLDGYSEVNVSTSGVDIGEYINSTIVYGQTRWTNMVKKLPTISCSSNVIDLADYFAAAPFTELTFNDFNSQNVKDMGRMFQSCSSLTSLDLSNFNTSNVTNMDGMFGYCSSLTNLDLSNFNTSKVTNIGYMFRVCSSLTNIIGCLQNLGQAYDTTKSADSFNYMLDLSYSSNLTHDSLINIINGLYDIATKGCNTQSLTIGSKNVAKLTAEEIAIATNKGWTVS